MNTHLTFQKILFAIFAFIAALICCRIYYSGSFLFIFLVWNIFLAWVPFTISYYLGRLVTGRTWQQALLFIVWLLFFPNALYIITDLIHLQIETSVPKWFDTILLFLSSVIGLIMAFISLYRVEIFLAKRLHEKRITVIITAILFLGSFGVYLGRFLRWNSWDIIRDPLGLLSAVIERFIFPFEHLQTWGVTLLLTILFYLLYFLVKKMPGYLNRAV